MLDGDSLRPGTLKLFLQEPKAKQLRAMARVLGLPRECGEEVLSHPAAVAAQAGTFSVGRARLPCVLGRLGPSSHEMLLGDASKSSKFAFTAHSTQTMQSIAVAVQMREPLLLVGESGTGKTTIIQHIAQQVCIRVTVCWPCHQVCCVYTVCRTQGILCVQVGKEVVAINFSSQSESSDLLGGMKPVQVGSSLMSLYRTFMQLLQSTWPAGKNADFLTRVHKFVRDENWIKLTEAFDVALKKVRTHLCPLVFRLSECTPSGSGLALTRTSTPAFFAVRSEVTGKSLYDGACRCQMHRQPPAKQSVQPRRRD